MPSLTDAWYTSWQRKLYRASFTSLRGAKVLCAFNALIDKIVAFDQRRFAELFHYIEPHVASVLRKSKRGLARVDSPLDVAAALVAAFKTGKAMHLPANFQLVNWLHDNFPHHVTAIGGQAGIMANQLALIGASPVLYVPQLSPQLASMFSPRVMYPKARRSLSFISVRHAGDKKQRTRSNWAIEFKKGDSFTFGNKVFTAPRSNRIIFSSPYHQPPLFETELVHELPRLGESIDAGILSGYQSLQPVYEDGSTFEYYLSIEELYLKMLRSHKNIPLHIEYVSTPFKDIDAAIYQHVARHVDSLGLNEIELVELADKLGFSKLARDIVKSENAVTLHAAAEKVMEALELKRLHVHNLGYHLVLLKKPIDVQKQRRHVNATLFGSLVATSRALHGRAVTRGEVQDALQVPINENGIHQMARMCAHLSLSRHRSEYSLMTGAFDTGKHITLIVPGQAASLTRRTTGLGDTLSACSFLAGL